MFKTAFYVQPFREREDVPRVQIDQQRRMVEAPNDDARRTELCWWIAYSYDAFADDLRDGHELYPRREEVMDACRSTAETIRTFADSTAKRAPAAVFHRLIKGARDALDAEILTYLEWCAHNKAFP